ncbi:hypothetical protein C0Z16_13040 [Paraburkholderia rhynchosiae]|uniref:Uncharacterized protein n=1 Tax=Paraburkholderia rhynchosiae TaxID=487049 RepID=A0ABX4V6J3_9BURK|nr:hypothetical protein C0Z16_13040 [Paraburkholderia rhynchosiae]
MLREQQTRVPQRFHQTLCADQTHGSAQSVQQTWQTGQFAFPTQIAETAEVVMHRSTPAVQKCVEIDAFFCKRVEITALKGLKRWQGLRWFKRSAKVSGGMPRGITRITWLYITVSRLRGFPSGVSRDLR